jgi:hypothetical protein
VSAMHAPPGRDQFVVPGTAGVVANGLFRRPQIPCDR